MTLLATETIDSIYAGYSYSYPHKSAYRVFAEPLALRAIWSAVCREALMLYFHVPFCEMRCGFCNLFTQTQPKAEFVRQYLEAFCRQSATVRRELDGIRFARFAIGGGTPTALEVAELARLFDEAAAFGVDPHRIPTSVESSPATATAERLQLLRERGVQRLSIGVQSFFDAEVHAIGRPQRSAQVHEALERIAAASFPAFNIDLIYGAPGQGVGSWIQSLEAALQYGPTELYLYPLYVRPMTGLGRKQAPSADSHRLELYRAGRSFLLENGFVQVSMRMFQARNVPHCDGPAYCCQTDGMLGLGCGARSYAGRVHYSTEFAVGAANVHAIIARYVANSADAFAAAEYGALLNDDERRRRFLLQSLLQCSGLRAADYRAQFGSRADDDFPEIGWLTDAGLAEPTDFGFRLTEAGIERSDQIGPMLYSARVRELMETFELR